MTTEQHERLEAMIQPGQKTWDLSPDDVGAIKAALDEMTELHTARKLVIFGKTFDEKTPFLETLLSTPEVTFINCVFLRNTVAIVRHIAASFVGCVFDSSATDAADEPVIRHAD